MFYKSHVLLPPLTINPMLCLGAAWLGVPHLWQPLPQAAHHGGGRPAHVQQRAHRRGAIITIGCYVLILALEF